MAKSPDFLETEMSDIPERQRSMRAVFEYSWNLLADEEQAVFMKLSIFRGGFTREAAQAVAGASLRNLMTLVNKSLLHRDHHSGRYEIHELLRQYGEDRLKANNQLEALQDQHKDYFLHWFAGLEADIQGRRQIAALEDVDADYENLQIAWYRAAVQRDFQEIGRALESFRMYFDMRSRFLEAGKWMRYALEHLEPPEDTDQSYIIGYIQIHYVKLLANGLGRSFDEFDDWVTSHLQQATQRGDDVAIGFCHYLRFIYSRNYNLDEAFQLSEQHFIRANHEFNLADLYHSKATHSSNVDLKKIYIDKTSELQNKIGNVNGILWSSHPKGAFSWQNGDLSTALDAFQKMAKLGTQLHQPRAVLTSMSMHNLVLFCAGQFEEAEAVTIQFYDMAFALQDQYWFQFEGKKYLQLIEAVKNDIYLTLDDLTNTPYLLNSGVFNLDLTLVSVHACKYKQFQLMKMMQKTQLTNYFSNRTPHRMVSNLMTLAMLKADRGEKIFATEIISYTLTCPPLFIGWLEKWSVFNECLDDLKRSLGEPAFNETWERGKSLDYQTLVAEIVEEFGID